MIYYLNCIRSWKLEAEIADLLHSEISIALKKVAARLKLLGHNLDYIEPHYDPKFASWEYELSDSDNELKPRIHFDTQVSVLSGYRKQKNTE
jgi:hypothetical protein